MSLALVPVFYAVIAIATLWLALLWCARFTPSRRARIVKVLIGVTLVWMLFVPFGGLPLWSRAFSFHPNPSLPSLGIVCAALWQRLLGIAVFKPGDWRAAWWFGVVGGSLLYLNPVIFGSVDLYFWGWDRETAVWSLTAGAVAMLTIGSRLGVLLLAALLAYSVNALESQNCWDYIMDPFYWLIAMAVLGKRAFACALGSWRNDASTGRNRAQGTLLDPVVATQGVSGLADLNFSINHKERKEHKATE
jgi:hypothetical protein